MKIKKVTYILLIVALLLLIAPVAVTAATFEDPSIEPYWYNPAVNWPGYIFLTLDQSKSGWNHGHAGIGGNNGQTIESFSNTNVAVFSNGYVANWQNCVTGGIYSVKNASSSQYQAAKNFAYNKVGTPYFTKLWDGDATFYCSELVYRAWKEAGITVGTNILGLIIPESIMNHSNTSKIYSFQ